MNFGIDIDDTISNTYETMLPYLEKYMNNVLNKEFNNLPTKIDYYNLEKKYGITNEEEDDFWENNFVEIIENVIPKKSSLDVLKKIKEKDHKLILITARFEVPGANIVGITKNWLKENGIEYDKLIVNSQNKLEIAQNENIDIFLDDSIRNCEMVSSGNIKTFMIKTQNNEFYENDKIIKVNSWDEFYEKIKEVI